jgi:hypothetical protein
MAPSGSVLKSNTMKIDMMRVRLKQAQSCIVKSRVVIKLLAGWSGFPRPRVSV